MHGSSSRAPCNCPIRSIHCSYRFLSAPSQRLRPCRGLLQSLLGGIARSQELQLISSEPELSAWLQEKGFPVDKLKVVPQQLEGQGRGLIASSPIPKGSLVLSLPYKLVLSPAVAAAESVLSPLLPEGGAKLPAWTLLVLFLAEQQYYLGRGLAPSNTAWAPYLNSLPRQPLGTILDWPPNEVTTLLAGSSLQHKASIILTAAEATWQDIQPIVTAARERGLCPADMFARADFDWAVSICLSRTVRLDDKGDEVVLCPFADLLNHSSTSNAFLVWDQQQQAVVLRADRDYAAGEQVFISYGFKSSGELLLSYGFCPAPGSNTFDAAFLHFGLDPKDPNLQEKQQALAARDMLMQETFGVLIDALPEGLLPYAAFCAARPKIASVSDINKLATSLFDEGKLPVVNGVGSEQIALEAVVQQCKAALRNYPQTAAADKQLADKAPAGGGFHERVALMASVRVRERQILNRTEFVAAQRVKQLKKSTRK